jgi:methylmalonyl-CoA/ethylmalonyl-CoA epimerase
MTIQIEKIAQVSIRVHDINRAISFYRDKLGLNFMFSTEKMAFFNSNGTSIMLAIPESEEFDHPGSVIYFQVNDIHSSYTILSEDGVKMRGKPHVVYKTDTTEEWMLFFEDEENNLLALSCSLPIRKNL